MHDAVAFVTADEVMVAEVLVVLEYVVVVGEVAVKARVVEEEANAEDEIVEDKELDNVLCELLLLFVPEVDRPVARCVDVEED